MDLNERIIALVKPHPYLYDTSLASYRVNFNVPELWDQLGREVDMSGERFKKKWQSLRTSYTKYLRSCYGPKAALYVRFSKWQWAESMDFLKKHVRVILADDTDDTIDLEASDQDQLEYPLCKPTTITYTVPGIDRPVRKRTGAFLAGQDTRGLVVRPHRNEKTNGEEKAQEHSSNDGHSHVTHKKIKQDQHKLSSIEYLMLSYARTIEKFSKKRQVETKMKMAAIILEAELEDMEEDGRKAEDESEAKCRGPGPSATTGEKPLQPSYRSTPSTSSTEQLDNKSSNFLSSDLIIKQETDKD